MYVLKTDTVDGKIVTNKAFHPLQRIVQTVRIPVVALRELRRLHEVVGGEEAGDHGVVQAAVHVDDLQVGVVLVTGETTGKTESSRQVARQRGTVEGAPVGVGLHVAPRVEMEIANHLFVGIGDVRVAAQAVGMHIVHAIDTVAAHADGGEAVCLRVSHVSHGYFHMAWNISHDF